LKRLRLAPQGLIGRVILVVMCAVLVEFVGSFILYEHEEIRALRDGPAVEAQAALRTHVWSLVVQQAISAAILGAGVIVVTAVLLRSLGGPLRNLTHAAESLGQGRAVHVPEEGAGDLRHLARAFNAMQTRISDLLAARTQALAAVGHDLRTPLARLRLRAGMVPDPETREALERDVEEMTAMLNSLLDYLGGRHESEPARLADLAAICMTLVDEASDAGGTVRYRGPEHLAAKVRPLAVKRAVNNLIENAVAYAGSAELSLTAEPGAAVLAVEDKGPGIAAEELGRVTDAFHRLDYARTRNTAGLGLGLSIVQRIALSEGGQLSLSNRPGGGLRAEIRLPYQA
jgi:signal transduction histidine kinase